MCRYRSTFYVESMYQRFLVLFLYTTYNLQYTYMYVYMNACVFVSVWSVLCSYKLRTLKYFTNRKVMSYVLHYFSSFSIHYYTSVYSWMSENDIFNFDFCLSSFFSGKFIRSTSSQMETKHANEENAKWLTIFYWQLATGYWRSKFVTNWARKQKLNNK